MAVEVTQQQLQQHATCIVATLAARNAPVAWDNPAGRVFADAGLIEIYLRPAQGTKVSQVMNLTDDVALAVGAPGTRIVQGASNLIVQIPSGTRQRVTIESLLSTKSGPYNAVIGRSLYGTAMHVDITDPNTPHALIAGTTGSGKTALAHSMLMSLVAQHNINELRLIVIDPKNERYHWLDKRIAQHLPRPIARTPEDAKRALKEVVYYMEKVSSPVTRLVVYVDEMADVVMTGGDEAMQALTRIAQRGRSAGVHLIGCTQKPSARELGPLLTANFPLRLVGRVVNDSDSRLACGQAGLGAEKLLGSGDFLYVQGAQVVRFQAAMPALYGTPDPHAAPVQHDWSAAPMPPQSQPSAAPVEIAAPASRADDEPMPADDLIDYQARIVLWYRRAVPKEIYTATEQARAVWPDTKSLAGGRLRRIGQIIKRADEMED
jgi:S-DNA-T family DNA segregation ATPase FtsK/SpoIIIE